MKKSIYFFLIISTAIIIGSLLYFNFAKKNEQNFVKSDKTKVAATIFPLADIARNIGGNNVEVVNILPPGASPHTFQAKPADIIALQDAKAIFSIGNGLDDWAGEMAKNADNAPIIVVDSNIKKGMFIDEDEGPEPQTDPHYWLSADNAKIITDDILAELVKIDPAHTDDYQKNAENYKQKLDNLKFELSAELSALPSKNLIVFHGSWNYFAKEYDLNIAGVFEPSPGKEPSLKYLKELNDTAKKYNIKSVFSEPQLSSGIIDSFVEDLGLKIFILDPLGGIGERNSYINLMRYNAQTIKNAL
ncbi:metal ABC transporter substrate-binding protein [Patescibacteria group bacterium]|nr:metal ABC transporter substrate-binding protein [Patescibacteria group bacterium]